LPICHLLINTETDSRVKWLLTSTKVCCGIEECRDGKNWAGQALISAVLRLWIVKPEMDIITIKIIQGTLKIII